MPAVTAPHGLCLLAPVRGLGVDWAAAVELDVQPARPQAAMPPLTARQQRIVAFIDGFTAEYGYSPSMREIGAAVDLVTPSAVGYQLRELAAKGYLVLPEQAGRPRALRLVRAGEVAG
jgi:hypothetical protein